MKRKNKTKPVLLPSDKLLRENLLRRKKTREVPNSPNKDTSSTTNKKNS